MSEHYVSVPEQGGGKLIPEGLCNPGQVYTVSRGKSGMIGVFRLESQMLPGNGKLERTGLGADRDAKESSNTAFNYLKANGSRISGSISTTSKDYIVNYNVYCDESCHLQNDKREDTMSDIFNRCHKEPGCICGTWKTRLTVLWC